MKRQKHREQRARRLHMDNQSDQNNQLNKNTTGEDIPASLFQLIDELKQLTLTVVSTLHQATHEEMLKFIETREAVVANIQKLEQAEQHTISPTMNAKLREEINAILSHDTTIMARLSEIQATTAEELNKSSVARKQRSAYDAAYSLDGVYFDKKK